MTVEEAVAMFSSMPEHRVLVAKPPVTWGAEAAFVKLTDDYSIPQEAKDEGYEYLIGRDEMSKLLAILQTKKVSPRTAAEFVIHFALNDSFPAWIDDVPDRHGDAPGPPPRSTLY